MSLITNFQIMTNRKSDTNNETCFSKTNFDSVHQFVLMKIKNSETKIYVYEGYELVLNGDSKIAFKQKGYTLFTVSKEFGICILPILSRDNERVKLKTNQLFCELVVLAKKLK